MKKIVLIFCLIYTGFLGLTSCSSDNNSDASGKVAISQSDLPSNTQNFLQVYFEGATATRILQANVPNIHNSIYTVLLNTGFEVDFDRDGNWTEIENEHNQPLPESFLTNEVSLINNYVKNNYSNNWIVAIEKENYGYSIELNNDLDLIFDHNQQIAALDYDSDDNEVIINHTNLPKNAQKFVNSNFSGAQYIVVKKETEGLIVSYRAYLSTGHQIEFDNSGNWIEIESKTNAIIPSALIPATIQTYIDTNYPEVIISSIEKEIYGYSVKIVQGITDIKLNFSSDGDFLGKNDEINL